jgi:hypothetical protein
MRNPQSQGRCRVRRIGPEVNGLAPNTPLTRAFVNVLWFSPYRMGRSAAKERGGP